ncbi:hypothetical protein CLAFUW4_11854 [Fulvia fulva]|nr:hypothetical protein CLAFUR4_11859 [Fulvia fulva]WPV18132.1 hypothetical protein CLAFUW4_11854 [Fulvia fulva]WPV33132.1 hypothetical protein CLAFUW7_11861 [Fulvia fulva]
MLNIESSELRRLLESKLPQEIYDEIRRLTFAYEPGLHEVHPDWKPPVQLQVCRAIRQDYAQSYFGHASTFLVDFIIDAQHRHLVGRWLSGMDQEYVRLIAEDHIILVDNNRKTGSVWRKRHVFAGHDMVFVLAVVSRAEAIELYEARIRELGKSEVG